MVINKKKCGIIKLKIEKASHSVAKELRNIPYVLHYKYLGCILDARLSLKKHVEFISRKIRYITCQLTSIRIKGHFRLNLSLYQTLIAPLYFLAMPLFYVSSPTEQVKYYKHFRASFKKFCTLPQSTSTELLVRLTGAMPQIMRERAQVTLMKIEARNRFEDPDWTRIDAIREAKDTLKRLPDETLSLIHIMYGKKCRECGEILNNNHLRT